MIRCRYNLPTQRDEAVTGRKSMEAIDPHKKCKYQTGQKNRPPLDCGSSSELISLSPLLFFPALPHFSRRFTITHSWLASARYPTALLQRARRHASTHPRPPPHAAAASPVTPATPSLWPLPLPQLPPSPLADSHSARNSIIPRRWISVPEERLRSPFPKALDQIN